MNDMIPGPQMRVGFIGAGAMGQPMIRNLCCTGTQVLVVDSNSTNADSARALGGEVALNLNELADCQVVICMLPDSAAVEETVLDPASGLASTLHAGSTLIDMGSSNPASTRVIGDVLHGRGIGFVDAPVSGGVAGAVAGTLTVMAGCEDAAFHQCKRLLQVFGSPVIHVGGLGAGHASKALNNLLSATALAATIEAIEIAKTYGVAAEKLLEVVNQSTGRSNASETKIAQHVLSGTYHSGFRLRLMLKDIETAVAMADGSDVFAPMAATCRDVWRHGAAGLAVDADQTEIARVTSARGAAS